MNRSTSWLSFSSILALGLTIGACKKPEAPPAAPAPVVGAPPTPPASAPAAAPTAAANVVELFRDGEEPKPMELATGTLSVRPQGDDQLEIVWGAKGGTGSVLASCGVNLAASTFATAQSVADGTVYVTCTTAAHSQEPDETTVIKLVAQGSGLAYAGSAHPETAGDAKLDPGKLKYEKVAPAAPGDATAAALRWVNLVAKNDSDAAVYTKFPLTVRSDGAERCAKTADPLAFHDKVRACLHENLIPLGHIEWKPSSTAPYPRLKNQLAAAPDEETVHLVSIGDRMAAAVLLSITADGAVHAIAYEHTFAEADVNDKKRLAEWSRLVKAGTAPAPAFCSDDGEQTPCPALLEDLRKRLNAPRGEAYGLQSTPSLSWDWPEESVSARFPGHRLRSLSARYSCPGSGPEMCEGYRNELTLTYDGDTLVAVDHSVT